MIRRSGGTINAEPDFSRLAVWNRLAASVPTLDDNSTIEQ